MIAFDVARLNNIEKIYGIDNQMGYNYSIGDYIENTPELENAIDPETYLQIKNNPFKDNPEFKKRYENRTIGTQNIPFPPKFCVSKFRNFV